MISRRAFLKSSGLAVVAFGVGGVPVFVNRTAHAAARGTGGRGKILVGLFQRGAMDGLAAVQPLGDAHLAALRPNLVLRAGEGGLIDLGNGFGLHPALAPLAPYWRDGRLAVVHGVGSPDATRSHFDAQDYMEMGTPGRKSTPTGWLARAAGLAGHDAVHGIATPFQSVALTPALPRSLTGAPNALAIADLDTFRIGTAAAPAGSLEALYADAADALVGETGRASFEAARLLERVRAESGRAPEGYPTTPLGRSLSQVARLIRADIGLEIAFAETGGWDTHVAQGNARGAFARQAGDLARSVAAFLSDLGPRASDVVLMTMTEFGRTVRQNGSGGTDHGRASAMFVAGESVRGGEVYGSVGALAPDALEDGRDLPVTTDFRALFAGVARGHLGVADGGALFPGWTGEAVRVMR